MLQAGDEGASPCCHPQFVAASSPASAQVLIDAVPPQCHRSVSPRCHLGLSPQPLPKAVCTTVQSSPLFHQPESLGVKGTSRGTCVSVNI